MNRIKLTLTVLSLTITLIGCNSGKHEDSGKSNNSSKAEVVSEAETTEDKEEVQSEDESEKPTEDTSSEGDSDKGFSDSDTIEQIEEKLEQKYGVDIVYGEDIRTRFDEEDEDLRAQKYTEEEGIRRAMTYVDEALAVFPRGLTEQLTYDDGSPLKIYLIGAVGEGDAPPQDGAIPAFADKDEKELYLAIDISLDGEINVPTVSHELTHIIDFKLHDLGGIDDDEWNKLNPEGFAYTEDYENYNTSEFADKYSYTTGHYLPRMAKQNADEVYFYYNYAITNAYEDRATLMENLIVDLMWDYEIAPELYTFPHVREKAQYYLDAIKGTFTMNEEDVDRWQTTFDTLAGNS